MDRLILDIKSGSDCPEYVFGTAKLRDLRVRPLFRDYAVSVENPMQIEPLCRSSKTDPRHCGEMIKRTAAA